MNKPWIKKWVSIFLLPNLWFFGWFGGKSYKDQKKGTGEKGKKKWEGLVKKKLRKRGGDKNMDLNLYV